MCFHLGYHWHITWSSDKPSTSHLEKFNVFMIRIIYSYYLYISCYDDDKREAYVHGYCPWNMASLGIWCYLRQSLVMTSSDKSYFTVGGWTINCIYKFTPIIKRRARNKKLQCSWIGVYAGYCRFQIVMTSIIRHA